MNRFEWDWKKESLKPDKDVKVFSTFSCGGSSSMRYKRAGFEVIGNVEIDPRMNAKPINATKKTVLNTFFTIKSSVFINAFCFY